MRRERRTSWFWRTAALIAAVAAGVGWLPGAAFADDSLVSADPAPGAALLAAPSEVTLKFASRIAVDDSHVAVSTARGDGLADGDVSQPSSNEIRLPIQPPAPGDLTVAYHVIFADGTGATGAYRFSVGTGIAPPALSVQDEAALGEATARHVHQVDPVGATLLVIDGAVLLVVVVLFIVRPRPGRPASSSAWRFRED